MSEGGREGWKLGLCMVSDEEEEEEEKWMLILIFSDDFFLFKKLDLCAIFGGGVGVFVE